MRPLALRLVLVSLQRMLSLSSLPSSSCLPPRVAGSHLQQRRRMEAEKAARPSSDSELSRNETSLAAETEKGAFPVSMAEDARLIDHPIAGNQCR